MTGAVVSGSRLVRRELGVADRLEDQPDQPHDRADGDQPRPADVVRAGHLQRQRDDQGRDALDEEDLADRERDSRASPSSSA